MDKIKQLRGVTFDWKPECEKLGFLPTMTTETGVIAQDVQKIIPDAAVPAPFDHDYLTVQHEKIIPLLIEAIKEQQEQIEELKKNSHPCKELHEFEVYPELIKRIEDLEKK